MIWSEDLKRFDDDEVIKRAKGRREESWYDILENNCEHFVYWCKCGLKVSLQVKSWHPLVRDFLHSLVAAFKEGSIHLVSLLTRALVASKNYIIKGTEEQVASPLARFLANVSDELAGLLSKKYAANIVGFALGLVLEIGVGWYEFQKANEQRKTGLIESDELLKAKKVEIVAKGAGRSGLGLAGSLIGGAVGGPVGSLICGAIGGAAGHLLGSCFANPQHLTGLVNKHISIHHIKSLEMRLRTAKYVYLSYAETHLGIEPCKYHTFLLCDAT